MDNKQAAAGLRENAEYCRANGPKDRAESYSRGADALDMLEWLFQTDSYGYLNQRMCYHNWNGDGDFRAFCEAMFEESKKGLTK